MMSLSDIKPQERTALLAASALVAVVFVVVVFTYVNPPTQVWEATVFDYYYANGRTIVYSYGEGKLKIPGDHEFELGETYRITYQSRKRNFASFGVTIEKIS